MYHACLRFAKIFCFEASSEAATLNMTRKTRYANTFRNWMRVFTKRTARGDMINRIAQDVNRVIIDISWHKKSRKFFIHSVPWIEGFS
jgi:hypothetical protein